MNSSGKFARRRGGKRTGKEYKLNTYEIQSFFYSLLQSSIVIVAVEYGRSGSEVVSQDFKFFHSVYFLGVMIMILSFSSIELFNVEMELP